jgi:hypothetical protein
MPFVGLVLKITPTKAKTVYYLGLGHKPQGIDLIFKFGSGLVQIFNN